MKFSKKYLFIFITLIFSEVLFSQKKIIEPEIYFGANIGETASMVNFSPSVNQTFLLGYNGGLIFRYIEDKYVGVQAELNYSQRGWNESNGLYSRQLNYIELPFMTHFYFGRNFRFFINVGPKIGYLISEKTLINNPTDPTEIQHSTNIQNPFDYGFCAGFGFLMRIKKQVFQIDARGSYSMSDIYSNAKKDFFDTSNNINASVNFAWLLQLKKNK
jgi:hypothetical protein